MTTLNNEKLVIYKSFSGDRFGGLYNIRVWNYGDDTTDCINYINQSIENWSKHRAEYLTKNDKEGAEYAQKYINQYALELKTVEVIDASEYDRMQKNCILTGAKEISEDVYWEMFECLPPLKMGQNYFIMSEFYTESYTRQFFKKNNKYFMQMIDYKNQDTWAVL